ncbi:MAG: ROK family protein [Planctomycetes bacterium]|nr:ROK family protein [Planctomycetota bacterium]
MSTGYWLGVDLGGTKILAGLFDDDLKLLARSKQPTAPETGPAGVVANLGKAVEAVVREANVDAAQIRGMGVGVPGQIDLGTTKVKFAPNLDWRDVDLKPLVPASWRWPIVLENDVRMGTYGEFAHGAAKGARHVLGVFVGTGVGGGMILNGDLFTGFNGNAGEIGHVVVHWRQGASLESIAGRKYMMKRAKEKLDDAPKRVRKEWKGVDLAGVRSSQLAEFYQKDDPVAVELVDDAARALGAAIGGLVNFVSPEVVVIGGGVTGALGDTFIERIWEIALRYTLPGAADRVRCVPAALGDDSGIVGCAAYAKAHPPA